MTLLAYRNGLPCDSWFGTNIDDTYIEFLASLNKSVTNLILFSVIVWLFIKNHLVFRLNRFSRYVLSSDMTIIIIIIPNQSSNEGISFMGVFDSKLTLITLIWCSISDKMFLEIKARIYRIWSSWIWTWD